MKDSVIAVQEDHVLKLALEKYNAQITDTSYEVRKMCIRDRSRVKS